MSISISSLLCYSARNIPNTYLFNDNSSSLVDFVKKVKEVPRMPPDDDGMLGEGNYQGAHEWTPSNAETEGRK